MRFCGNDSCQSPISKMKGIAKHVEPINVSSSCNRNKNSLKGITMRGDAGDYWARLRARYELPWEQPLELTPACVVSKSAPPQVEEAGQTSPTTRHTRIATEFVQLWFRKN